MRFEINEAKYRGVEEPLPCKRAQRQVKTHDNGYQSEYFTVEIGDSLSDLMDFIKEIGCHIIVDRATEYDDTCAGSITIYNDYLE